MHHLYNIIILFKRTLCGLMHVSGYRENTHIHCATCKCEPQTIEEIKINIKRVRREIDEYYREHGCRIHGSELRCLYKMLRKKKDEKDPSRIEIQKELMQYLGKAPKKQLRIGING